MSIKKIDKKKVESYLLYVFLLLPVILFIVTPAFPSNHFHFVLNDFMDKYMLGNGYYLATDYPFTAKVSNNFTVAFAVVSGIFIGVWRRNEVEREIPPSMWWYGLVLLGIGWATFSLSLNPQEFVEPTSRRSFGTSESFHNNPAMFIGMIIMKEVCIYGGLRGPITLLFYIINRIKK